MLVWSWLGNLTVLAEPQLWQPDLWEPERRAKSIAFLGKDEQDGEDGQQEEQQEEQAEELEIQEGSESKKAILNVSDKDSPYALIDKYFPERESYFYQNKNKFLSEFSQDQQDIGNLEPNEVSTSILSRRTFLDDLMNKLVYCALISVKDIEIIFTFKNLLLLV